MKQVSKQEALEIFKETYEEHAENGRDVPKISVWFRLKTGWLPAWQLFELVILPWEIVLEHGRRYVRYVQNHYDNATKPGYIDERVKLVGGSFPW